MGLNCSNCNFAVEDDHNQLTNDALKNKRKNDLNQYILLFNPSSAFPLKILTKYSNSKKPSNLSSKKKKKKKILSYKFIIKRIVL